MDVSQPVTPCAGRGKRLPSQCSGVWVASGSLKNDSGLSSFCHTTKSKDLLYVMRPKASSAVGDSNGCDLLQRCKRRFHYGTVDVCNCTLLRRAFSPASSPFRSFPPRFHHPFSVNALTGFTFFPVESQRPVETCCPASTGIESPEISANKNAVQNLIDDLNSIMS